MNNIQNIEFLIEMAKSQLKDVEKFADENMNPVDVEFTRHFFDRLHDPRNGKEISQAELIGFFKRLSKNKERFLNFLKKYQEFVIFDPRTQINIPFVKNVNQIIAKTLMRKNNFLSSNPKFQTENNHSLLKFKDFMNKIN